MPLASVERQALADVGQGHILERLERLEEAGRRRLHAQVAALDLRLLKELRGRLGTSAPAPTAFEPPELFPLERGPDEEHRASQAGRHGEELLAAGRVGYVLVAGGQASRLGYDAPKGAFPVGPVTGRSLFELHARRLVAARRRYGSGAPWYVMTSPVNDADTRTLFAEADHFGLPPEDVFFFSQDMLPALDEEGRVLFAAPDRLFLAPNGHGGCLLGLESSGALDDMRRRGLEQLSYFQVDNPLVRPADPLFLGLSALAGAGMSTKVVEKHDPGEKVGVIGRIDGRMGCIEYSDLPPERREEREPRDGGGKLRFRAGNIAVHILAVDFVERITRGGLDLPWHLAQKTMSVVGVDGEPCEVVGTKFETFVFDALAKSPASVTLEVERAREFSPVKNAAGGDSPATARADLCRLYEGWVRAAGLALPAADTEGNRPLEVDPCLAETQDEFLARLPLEPDVRPTGHFYDL